MSMNHGMNGVNGAPKAMWVKEELVVSGRVKVR